LEGPDSWTAVADGKRRSELIERNFVTEAIEGVSGSWAGKDLGLISPFEVRQQL
jgi:hypothetical protein